MNLTEVLIIMAGVLLASQVAVVITLVVLFKKFKALKDQMNKYKIKQNRNSLPMLIVKEPTDENNRPRNEYVDGKRPPCTYVRTNSEESIVYVPTPEPERRSKNYDDKEASFCMEVFEGPSDDPDTPYIENVNINSGYDVEPGEKVYGNQVIIDMVEKDKVADSFGFDVTPDNEAPYLKDTTESKKECPAGSGLSVDNCGFSVRKVTKSKKSVGSDKVKGEKINNLRELNQEVMNKQKEISKRITYSEERGHYYEGYSAEEITVEATQEPIYENVREKRKSRESFS